jgi:succinate dehydrogenase / fumarate reductase flavoprotein subunit
MSNIPGLFVLGEANFSDHGANRLGASALMQGLADGYFVIPYTLANYLAEVGTNCPNTDTPEFVEVHEQILTRISELLSIKGKRSPRSFHVELGKIMWEHCGVVRDEQGLKKALELIPQLRGEFWKNVRVVGNSMELNQELERAGRVADFLEFAEVMCHDALNRNESCGCHFRTEHQTGDGEAKRDDANFSNVTVWEFKGDGQLPKKHVESLKYETVKMSVRSYK